MAPIAIFLNLIDKTTTMSQIVIIVLVSSIILIGLFLLLREFNTWYWKINESLTLQKRTNFLLEKISLQLGAANPDEITVEEISTGKRKKVDVATWLEYKASGYSTYKAVKDEPSTDKG
jgi:hypothetical protein